ncbi:MAG: precorrin-8X methylmutase [Anaerolineae bacterium]|nr:precorrin-8X methylmutase [Anaerolineae bacterium]
MAKNIMLPHEIERESFRIIQAELGLHTFNEAELAIIVRVIHATGDFDFARIIRFHPQAIESGLEALRRGAPVVTDVAMVQAGIANDLLSRLGGRTICDIRAAEVYALAQAEGITRSAAAMRHNAVHIQNGIVAIGNAPAALLEVLRLIREEGIRPALIVGVPVGFVNAAESKEELTQLADGRPEWDVPYITTVGRKGGSTVAVAIVNALLRLALEH